MTLSEPIISVSGLRGIVGESLSPESAARFACAFAAGLPPGPILLSRDGRTSGGMLGEGVRAGLRAVGRDVLDVHVAATPTVGVLVRTGRLVGGIQISASHNPREYNGIKLFDAEGKVITAEQGQPVIERYRSQEPKWVTYDRVGGVEFCDDVCTDHAKLVLRTVDVARIRERGFRVLLDSNHGAGGILGSRLLELLGCHVTMVGGTPDGCFAHLPEPTAENLQTTRERIQHTGVDVGFCQDPDADRLAVIDETGRYIGEEFTLALCLEHVLAKRPGTIVTNCATSRMAEDLAERFGGRFVRTPVGEANVVAAMQEQQAVFGGEGNGGPIDPRVGFVRDSFVGMAQILDAMAERGLPVSQLADGLPQYAIHKTKATVAPERVDAAFEAVRQRFPDATTNAMDGLRLDWPGRWLLVRASNTEPIVRAIAEATTLDEATQLCQTAVAAMEAAD